MRKISFQIKEEQYAERAEITDMEKLLESESIHEAAEEADEYTDYNIICFTFEDGMIPKKNGKIGTQEQFDAAFKGNSRVMSNKNVHGVNVFISTERDDLYNLGYIIMNTKEFIKENPDGLFDDWVGLLDEVRS